MRSIRGRLATKDVLDLITGHVHKLVIDGGSFHCRPLWNPSRLFFAHYAFVYRYYWLGLCGSGGCPDFVFFGFSKYEYCVII